MVRVLRPDATGLALAVDLLRSGNVVGMPTETVYGLAADARDARAVARIFGVKRRPADNPLIVHVAGPAAIGCVADGVPPLAATLAAAFWPGPLTLVLDARSDVPSITTGGLHTVAVRVPDHPVAAALLEAFDGPLAAPSANRSGRPSPTLAVHVADEFGDDLEVVLDGGACSVGLESTVVDVRGGRPVVLREGAVTHEDLAAALGGDMAGLADTPHDGSAASPGTRYRHYAPRCAIELVAPGSGPNAARARAADGVTVGLIARTSAPEGVVDVATFVDAASLAGQLYAALRAAEAQGVDVLVVEAVEEVGVGRAVMDRLRRASA